jgi:hypothetical protein
VRARLILVKACFHGVYEARPENFYQGLSTKQNVEGPCWRARPGENGPSHSMVRVSLDFQFWIAKAFEVREMAEVEKEDEEELRLGYRR